MNQDDITALMPPCSLTTEGKPRRIGVEIELAGIEGDLLARSVSQVLGGRLEQRNRYEYQVLDTALGDFTLELDSEQLKKFERALSNRGKDDKAVCGKTDDKADDIDRLEDWLAELGQKSSDLISLAAEQFVPWEIVSAPIPISSLGDFNPLLHRLRQQGAKGTRHAARFAFGVHLNPELPALDSETILHYLQAYLCLYDWIVDREQVDFTRRLTPYISHFKRDYIGQVVNPNYLPDQNRLIDDYLRANPTRNRSLDLLPLFAHLDESRVRSVVQDSRVKARPTFHYRLPNCDIDNPDWNLWFPWRNWLPVERLACDTDKLATICEAYSHELQRLAGRIDNNWLNHCRQWVRENLS